MIQFWMLLEPRKARTIALRLEEKPANPCKSPTLLLKPLTLMRGNLLHREHDHALMEDSGS